jgi:hypothetical protein
MSRVDLRAAIQEQRHDHGRDHGEHHPRGTRMAAKEAAFALLLRWRVLDPNNGEHAQRHEHRCGEEVLDESEPVTLTDPGNVETSIEE